MEGNGLLGRKLGKKEEEERETEEGREIGIRKRKG